MTSLAFHMPTMTSLAFHMPTMQYSLRERPRGPRPKQPRMGAADHPWHSLKQWSSTFFVQSAPYWNFA